MENNLTLHEYYHKRLLNYLRLQGSKSINTLTVYRSNLDLILKHFPEPEKVDLLQIQDFAVSFTNDNTRKNICVLLRFLFNKVLNKNISWTDLPYPKKKQKVQPVYLQDDILKVLHTIQNPKQKAILALIIDCGLRVSEPCSILISDCNSKERSMLIRGGKGDKDRIVYPSQFAWDLIKEYWNKFKDDIPVKFLFEGQFKGNPYTPESIRGFLESNCKKCGVKYLGVHAIRRFTGTWWIENEVPLTVAAKNLGHSGTQTLEKHYIIHSPKYLKSIPTPLT